MITVAEILKGEKVERTNEAARAGKSMTEAEVRWFISKLEAENPNENARKKMAQLGSSNIANKISPEGVALYKKYLKTFG